MTPVPAKSCHQDSGFTLLEVMVAVAILAIALTSLLGSQSASVGLATETRFHIQAPLLARKQLAELVVRKELFPGEGEIGEEFPDFHWELKAEEAFFEESEILQKLDTKLWHLTMIIRWGDNPLFTYQLDTYRQQDK
jgi:general secretion pathway protein I